RHAALAIEEPPAAYERAGGEVERTPGLVSDAPRPRQELVQPLLDDDGPLARGPVQEGHLAVVAIHGQLALEPVDEVERLVRRRDRAPVARPQKDLEAARHRRASDLEVVAA